MNKYSATLNSAASSVNLFDRLHDLTRLLSATIWLPVQPVKAGHTVSLTGSPVRQEA